MEKRKIIEWVLRIILGGVFCFSAYTKIIVPGVIEIILVDHGFATSREVAAIYVRLLVGVEFALGLLFFQPYFFKHIVLPSAILFLIGFTTYLIYTGFILGDSQNCGCFGEMIKMSPTESIIKNILLSVPVVYLFIKTKVNNKNIFVPIIIFLAGTSFAFIISPIKQKEDFKFRSYTSFTGRGRTDLTEGNKLLAVFNTECDHCQETAKELAKIQNNKNFPQMFVLFFTEGSISVDSFKTMTQSNFPYAMISAREFFNLIGQSPPRIYWLQNGKVNSVWDKEFKKNIETSFSIKE